MGLEIEDNRFKISLGVDLWEKKDDKKGKWDLFKKSINDISKNSKDEKDKYEKYKKLKKAIEGEKFESEINKKKFDVDLLGYVEGYIVDGKPIFTGFGGEITGKFQFKHTTQVTVGPIPVYVYAKAGADLSAAIKYAQLFPDRDAPWDLGVVLKGGPLFQVGVGPGIEEAASVGFYGKGNFPFTVDFTNCHLLFQIEGNFGVEASLLCFEYKKPLVEWTWTALDKYYGPAKALRLRANKVLPNQPKLLERQKQTLEASVMSREYLENTSRWQGDSLLKRTFGIRTDIADGLTVKELQTSVFKNSKSQLVSLDDGRMIMAYIEDDGSRDAYNRMRLVYSVCENGFWSKPRAVCDDGTNDDCPVLGTDGKTVYIAWQNTNREFTEDDEKSADSILKSVEISFAEFNTETNEFENSKTLTSNNSYDYIPCIAVENGEAAVYWVNNDQDDLKKPGSNTIYRYSTSKKETESIKSNVNYILNADCTFDEFSYTTDTDGALSDTKDINVFIVSNGKARAVSNSDKADFNVAYGKLEGENTLFYSNMSGVYYYDGNKINSVFETNRSVSGDLQVLENGKETSLIWSETSENGSELWFCNYAEGKWSQPVQITKLGAVLSNIALVYQNGIIHGVFDRSERSFTNDTYVTGQTDLCYMTLADYTELETKFEFFDESMLKPGKTVKIPVNLTNNGTKNIHSVDILLKDTLGTVITANKVVDLLSGADMTVEIDYPVSMNLERTTLEVTATASNEEEINTLNNTDRIELGFADIGIRDVKVEEVGEYFVLTTLISNDNAVVAKDVELKAYSQDKDGKLIGYADIGDLQPGEMKSIQYIVSKNSLEFDEKGIDKICLAVSTSSEEKITDDNITTAVIKGVYILYGDVNGDKVIDGKDVISMRKYFADYNDETETSSVEIFVGADANGDGTVNGKDLILLRQYLANYNDDTGESSVVLGPQGI